MSDLTFEAWPKIARLNRDCIITEKIDGTNAAVIVTDDLRVGALQPKVSAAYVDRGTRRARPGRRD